MQYLGAKTKIAKKIINFMEAEREEGMTWVEPFMGSGKVISQVKGPRIGCDINHELISLFRKIQEGYEPPKIITEDQYYKIKNNQEAYPDYLKGFVSFACAFGAMRWSTYAKNSKGENYALRGYRSLMKQKPLLKGVNLCSGDYKDLQVPPKSLIYCDPPYINTAGYGFEFDHEQFYKWCKDKVAEGHLVFISEYEAPFEEVWSKTVNVTLNKDKIIRKTEKLYRVHKAPPFKLRKY